MKKLLLLSAVGAALALGACGSIQAMLPGGVRLPADQALLVAEAGTDGINRAATVGAGAMNAQQAATVQAGLDAANNAVSAAHAAYVKGDISSATVDLSTAMTDIATVESEVKK